MIYRTVLFDIFTITILVPNAQNRLIIFKDQSSYQWYHNKKRLEGIGMGNKWEIVETKSSLSKACPCGKGGLYNYTNILNDDYGRTREEHDEPSMTCNDCRNKYVSSTYGWMPREYVQTYSDLKAQHKLQKSHIHQTIKDKYLERVIQTLQAIPTKKELYEVLSKTPGLYTPSTLETFRKHLNQYGFDSAIQGIDEFRSFKSLLHLIQVFNIELNQDENAMITEWKRMNTESIEFLKSHSVEPGSKTKY